MTSTNDTSTSPLFVSEHPDLVIRAISVSSMDNIVYLLTCRRTGALGLIDAADASDRILALIAEAAEAAAADSQLQAGADPPALAWVLTTHQHWDHHRALAAVLDATHATSYAGTEDADALPVPADVHLAHQDTVTLGELSLTVAHLRGHTPGSVALILTSSDGTTHAFTGDSLFPGGVGNTRGNAANFESLITDVEERLFAVLPDDATVYPGHGGPTTIGAERPNLAEWRERGW